MASLTIRQRLRTAVERAKRELDVYRCVLRDPRTPRLARWCLGLALAYLVTPVDLVPDFIPVVGHLDDLLIVPALIFVARRLIPLDVWVQCRHRHGM